jgi:hypothetical protein
MPVWNLPLYLEQERGKRDMQNMMKKIGIMMLIVLLMATGLSGCSKEAAVETDPSAGSFYTSRSHYTDPYYVHRALEVLRYEYEQNILTKEQVIAQLDVFIREIEGSDSFKLNYPYMSIEKRGNTYGIIPSDNPVGGGQGYTDIITKGKYNVRTADQLVDALSKVKAGETIFIEGDAKIDMTDFCIAENYVITLPDNVTLAGDRGHNGSKGGMLYTTAIRAKPLIQAGSNVRITGLCIQGPDPMIRDWKNKAMGCAITTDKDGLIVENCEISGFNDSAIKLTGGKDHKIRNNYIHHNRSINVGHGVYVEGATAIVEYNLFNYNRNSVAGVHKKGTGIEVKNNVFLDTADEYCIFLKETKSKNTADIVEFLVISNNTFFTLQTPFYINKLPSAKFEVTNNYFTQAEKDLTLSVLFGDESYAKQSQVTYKNNEYGLAEKANIGKNDEALYSVVEYAKKHTPDMRLTNITSRIYYTDLNDVLDILQELYVQMADEDMEVKTVDEYLVKAVRTIEKYDRAYDYLDNPNITIDGVVYGVIPDDNPLGGGYGYKDIYTTGDYVVETAEELFKALLQAKEGEVVFIKGDAVIDLTTTQATLTVRQGVTLASDRGYNGSTGALIFCDAFFGPLLTTHDNARITGLTIRGGDPEKRLEHHARSFSGNAPKGSSYYYRINAFNGINTTRPGLTVDNCEIAGFSSAAINVSNDDHHVHHNYLHHNQRNGLGYGVCLAKATVLIEYNLMNANRHDIAGTGAPGSGYIARHNLQMGESLSHCFDMHGGADRQDGTNIAGDTILMYNNMFLSDRYPYWIRGIPQTIQEFHHNVVYPPLSSFEPRRLVGTGAEEKAKFILRDNVFNLKDDPTVLP